MTLDRAHVTIASRVMLKVYPAFAAGVALSFILTPRHRLLATPSFRYMNDYIPLPVLGWGFAAVAAGLVVALIAHNRRVYQLALSVMVVWMSLFAFANVAAATYGQASFAAWTWPAFVAAACWASLLSLERKET